MSYFVVKDENGICNIVEKETNTTIEIKTRDEQKIRSVCRKLNLGGGFSGFTPSFFAKKSRTVYH